MRKFAICLLLLIPAQANATTVVNEAELDGAPFYRQWISEARGRVPLPERVSVLEWERSGGQAWPLRSRIAIDFSAYLWTSGPGYERDQLLTQVIFLHELGHIWDLELRGQRNKQTRYRDRYRRVMGLPAHKGKRHRWLSRHRFYEGFADAYARCATDQRLDVYAYPTTKRQHRRICKTLREIA